MNNPKNWSDATTGCMLGVVLLCLAGWITIGFIVYHFVSKYW